MSGVDTLERIKRAEEEADLAVAKAEEDYKKALDAARKEADAILERSKMREQVEYDRIMSESMSKIREESSKLEAEHNASISSMGSVTKRRAMDAFESAIRKVFGV